jgi:hypothetical protein
VLRRMFAGLFLAVSIVGFQGAPTTAQARCTQHPLDCTNPTNSTYGCVNPVTVQTKTSSSGTNSITYQHRFSAACPSSWSRIRGAVCTSLVGCFVTSGGAYPFAYRDNGSITVPSTYLSSVYNPGLSAYSRQVHNPTSLPAYACGRLTNINGDILVLGCSSGL